MIWWVVLEPLSSATPTTLLFLDSLILAVFLADVDDVDPHFFWHRPVAPSDLVPVFGITRLDESDYRCVMFAFI